MTTRRMSCVLIYCDGRVVDAFRSPREGFAAWVRTQTVESRRASGSRHSYSPLSVPFTPRDGGITCSRTRLPFDVPLNAVPRS